MQWSSSNATPLPQAAPVKIVALSMQLEVLACLVGKHASGPHLSTTCGACLRACLGLSCLASCNVHDMLWSIAQTCSSLEDRFQPDGRLQRIFPSCAAMPQLPQDLI